MPAKCRFSLPGNLAMAISVAVLALVVSDPANAARPDTRAMTCENGKKLVRQSGAIVMTTGTHTYARIVSGTGYCGGDEETELKVVPSRDNARCRIGYICRARINDDDPFWRLRR
ncbi:MAG: hypothetical protein R3D34_18250 [Nitratireductor sp.]